MAKYVANKEIIFRCSSLSDAVKTKQTTQPLAFSHPPESNNCLKSLPKTGELGGLKGGRYERGGTRPV